MYTTNGSYVYLNVGCLWEMLQNGDIIDFILKNQCSGLITLKVPKQNPCKNVNSNFQISRGLVLNINVLFWGSKNGFRDQICLIIDVIKKGLSEKDYGV